MADVRWKDKTLLAYAGMDTTDTMPITDTSVDTDKYTTLAEVKKYALENKTIGGSAVGDVTTNNGTQTLTGKRLDSPKINENVAVTAKATEINKLTGCTATTAELNLTHTYAAKIPYLTDVTSAIQAQINGLGLTPTAFTYCYGLTFVADDAEKKLSEAAILTALGISTSLYYIDYTSMHGTTCTVSAGTYTVIDDTGAAVPNVAVKWTTQTTSGTVHLDTLSLTGLSVASSYNVAFSFKIFEIPGI